MNFTNEIDGGPGKKPAKKITVDPERFTKNLALLLRALEATKLDEFVGRLSRPGRILWLNFWAGVAKGFGILVGMTIVAGVLIWVLAKMVDFPLIGQYFWELKNLLEEVAVITPKE